MGHYRQWTTVCALWFWLQVDRARRKGLNILRLLPGPFRWFHPGWCVLCGRFGWVFHETGEHEQCWLDK